MMPRTSIFLAAEDVARLRSQIHNPHMARIWERTRRTADRIAGEQSVSFAEDTMELWYVFRNRCIDLGIALLATGEKRYARAAHAVLQDLAQRSVDFWQGPHYPNRPRTQMVDGVETLVGELETAQLTMGLALLYDLAYEHLAEEDRALALHLLRQRAYPLLRASVRFQSQKWVMNHLCVIASAWLAALLLLPKGEREEADFALAVHSLNLWLGNLESDGSYGEGYHYWAYPVNCLYFALQALRNALGMRLEREGRLARAFEWALYHQAGIIREAGYEKPIAASVNFHDCPRFFQMEAPEALLFANLMGNSVAQWYIQRFLLEDLSRPEESLHVYWHRADALLLALYRPEARSLSPQQAGWATARCFMDTGYQFLRSGWNMESDLVFAMESGGGTRSRAHEHHDRNSFLLYAKGELFLADPGHSCYRGALHNAYDTRTRAHSTWAVPGEEQSLAYLEMGMRAEEAQQYPSYYNAAIPAQQLHPEISLVDSQARRCYSPAWRDYTRRAFLVYGRYILLWDSVDTGRPEGGPECPLTLNARDGNLQLRQVANGYRLLRPRGDLYLYAASSDGALSFREEPGILHDAYHIRPGMKVEGKPGSAVRLVLCAGGARFESVMVLYPLEKEETPPEVCVQFDGEAIRVKIAGEANDSFFLSGQETRFCRKGGAQYSF